MMITLRCIVNVDNSRVKNYTLRAILHYIRLLASREIRSISKKRNVSEKTKKYLDICKYIESQKLKKKKVFYIEDLFSIKTQVKTYAKVFVSHMACILVGICHD